MPRHDPLDYPEWLQANPGPDLTELITRHGGYGHIPLEAWTEFNRRAVEWEARRRDRLARGTFAAKNKASQTGRGKNKA